MPPKAAPPSAAATVLEAPKVRPPATQEVLAQAQERWTLGERAPAIALLQSAITRLEGVGASEATALAALTREYVRMTLAQGQLRAASAMLTRLEQPLAGVADIWALRCNVAQRLGYHQEAVRAYLKSLALRPNEPRWMLGAAVSLAAQGQVGPAGELAEQARQAGALQPDVANYLRQLGVAVSPD
jgi:MSHA biogenesis protein MshN